MVYAFEKNKSGVSGLGHENEVKVIVIIEELYHKRVIDFKTSRIYVFARTFDGKVYSRSLGEKPKLLKSLRNENLVDICCSLQISIALFNKRIFYEILNKNIKPLNLDEFHGYKFRAKNCSINTLKHILLDY
jgi:hypothetical protein